MRSRKRQKEASIALTRIQRVDMNPRKDTSDQPTPSTTQQELPRGRTSLLSSSSVGDSEEAIEGTSVVVNFWPRNEVTTRGKPADTTRERLSFDYLTECLPHPTSDQAPMSSGPTLTHRARHHLRSSAQEFGFNPDSAAPMLPFEPPTSWFPRDIGSFWKIPPAQLSSGILSTTISDFNCIDWTDLISGQQTLSLANGSAVITNRSSCTIMANRPD